MKKIQLTVACACALALCGCFTWHETEPVQVQMSQVPKEREIKVALSGFAATITEYIQEYPADGPHLEACLKMIEDLNDRLDRKAFENARLYYKMEDYLAARVALRNVLKDNADNGYREDILYYTAMASYHYARMSVVAKQKERYLTFVDDYLNFIGEYGESKSRRELDAMYRRSQRALGRYDGIDEELEMKAKDFERDRKTAEKESSKNN